MMMAKQHSGGGAGKQFFTREELLRMGLEADDLVSVDDMPKARGPRSAFRQSNKWSRFVKLLEAVKKYGKRPPTEVSFVFRDRDLSEYFHGKQRVLAAKMNVAQFLKDEKLEGAFELVTRSKENELWIVSPIDM